MVNGINSFSSQQVINNTNMQTKLEKSKQVVSDNFESNSAIKTISGATGDSGSMRESMRLVPLLYIFDKIFENSMGGDVEKSSLGRAGKIGDKISSLLHLDNIISEEKSGRFSNFLKNNRFTKYFTNAYKAVPKSSFAHSQTIAEKYLKELNDQAQKFIPELTSIKYSPEIMQQLEGVASPETMSFIKNLGPLKKRLTSDYLSSVSRTLSELTNVAEQHMGTIGADDKKIIEALKSNISKFLSGADDISEKALSEQIASLFSRFGDKAHKTILNQNSVSLSQEAIDMLGTVSNKTFSKDQILPVIDDLSTKGINLSGVNKLSIARNKYSAADSKVGKTLLGKIFSKGALKTKDIVTYGGGLISMFFMASAIYNSVKAANEAPKGEKKATFMHVLSEQYLGMILFQPSISLLYKVGGNKYRGMTVEAREALKNLIKQTNADSTITKDALKVAKMQRDLLIKGVDKDKVAALAGKSLDQAKSMAKSLKKEGAKLKFWEKPLKFIGSLLSTGLDKMQKPKYVNLPKLGVKKIPQPTLKGFVGGLGRFALIMFVIQPIIQKPLTKLFHKIFGEPKTYLEKQKALNNSTNGSTSNNIPNNVSQTETNLIKKWTQPAGQEDIVPDMQNVNIQNNIPANISATPIANSDAADSQPLKPQKDDAIPAINIFDKDKNQKNENNRYIPSIEPVVLPDNSAEIQTQVDSILKNTDKIIQSSKKYL